jgi:hypothetical protein
MRETRGRSPSSGKPDEKLPRSLIVCQIISTEVRQIISQATRIKQISPVSWTCELLWKVHLPRRWRGRRSRPDGQPIGGNSMGRCRSQTVEPTDRTAAKLTFRGFSQKHPEWRYATKRRRRSPAAPRTPVPSRARLDGSGTGEAPVVRSVMVSVTQGSVFVPRCM